MASGLLGLADLYLYVMCDGRPGRSLVGANIEHLRSCVCALIHRRKALSLWFEALREDTLEH